MKMLSDILTQAKLITEADCVISRAEEKVLVYDTLVEAAIDRNGRIDLYMDNWSPDYPLLGKLLELQTWVKGE